MPSRFLYGNEGVEQLKEMMIGKVSIVLRTFWGYQLWLTLWNFATSKTKSNFRGQ
jgi:hypothetical protein